MFPRKLAIVLLIILFICIGVGCASMKENPKKLSELISDTLVKVTFINNNPYVTSLGIAKYIVDENGEAIDYEVINIRWAEGVKTIELMPGWYGVTQYSPIYDSIYNYKNVYVKEKPITIEFERLT